MNAMTWYDHQTESVWSQVWGQAIAGPLKGTTLRLIPASMTTWAAWKADHPDTLAMTNDKTGFFNRQEKPRDNWVVGVVIGADSKAFYYTALVREGVVNDYVGPYPVVLTADKETRSVHVYLRQVNNRELTLALDAGGEYLVDTQNPADAWSVSRGLPRDRPAGEPPLLPVPYISSFDWAWSDFHPGSEFYE